MISVRDGWLSICGKNLRADFLGHYCQTLHDGITHWALLIHTTFSDFDCISRAQQCQTVLTENFMFFSDYVETAIVDYVKIMNTTIFFFSHIFKGDNWHVSSLEKNYVGFFWHHYSKIFPTLHDYNLARGLHCHSRFDDLDCFKVTSVSQM